MTEGVRHPRAFAAFRAGLYVLAGALALVLALSGLGILGAIAVLGAVAVVTTGDVNLLALGGLWGLVALAVALCAVGLRYGVRRVEATVRDADALPDPLDELKREYVGDRIDERELEHRLADVLDDAPGTADDAASTGRLRYERHEDEAEPAT